MADQNVKDGREKIKVVRDFMKDIEYLGGKVPPGLKKAVDRYLLAVEMGLDLGEATQEVSEELHKVYEDAYRICGDEQTDDYWVCRARFDRLWQSRNVKAVLNWNDDASLVRKVWSKWKETLAKWLEGQAKARVKKALAK